MNRIAKSYFYEEIKEIERRYNGPWLPNEGACGLTGPRSSGFMQVNNSTYYVELVHDYTTGRNNVDLICKTTPLQYHRKQKLEKLNKIDNE